ncbi:helix-turn-helix domain-containing protein [Virgibacillus byunsanensis]|uniref:Helix-turn-helix domain-containing protein n=1 Tax=Virgibacillus byunsanensis TaxID=570945 RepID=A0ABW3LGK8_9BACI
MNVDKQLFSLINATKVLTSTRDLDEVLHLLIKEVLSVFNWADVSILFLWDSHNKHLKAKSSVGFDMDYLDKLTLQANEGMSGKAFSLEKAQLYKSSDDTSQGMSNVTKKNFQLYKKALKNKKTFPTSAISAPLMKKDECFGVLTIDSYSNSIEFTEDNLMLLQTFANQAMIAIENATLLSQNDRSNRIHNELTKIYMSHQGLTGITRTLSSLINNQICVCDEFFNLLSYTYDSAKEIVEELRKKEPLMVGELFSETNLAYRTISLNDSYYDISLFAINIENETTGVLMVINDKNEVLDSLDIFAVEQATTVFALELQSRNQYISNHFNYEGYLMKGIINNPEKGVSILKSKRFYKENNQYMILKIEIVNELTEFKEIHATKQSFSRLLYNYLSMFQYRSLVYEDSMEYSILFLINKKVYEEEIHRSVYVMLEEIKKRSKLSILAGMGRCFIEMSEINSSINDSNKCVEFMKMIDVEHDFMSYKELGAYRLLLNIEPKELDNFLEIKLQTVLDYDLKQKADLVNTLELYLYFNQNIRKTAEKMYLHENTIKYRINKVKKIMGITEFNGDITFEINLALKTRTFLNRSFLFK